MTVGKISLTCYGTRGDTKIWGENKSMFAYALYHYFAKKLSHKQCLLVSNPSAKSLYINMQILQ